MAAADLSCHTDKLPMTIRKVFYHFYLLKSEKNHPGSFIPNLDFSAMKNHILHRTRGKRNAVCNHQTNGTDRRYSIGTT